MATNQALPASLTKIKQLVKKAKRDRINRVYYYHDFKPHSLKKLGVVRSEEKNKFDLVSLDCSANEAIRFHSFDEKGSYFELDLKISSLHGDVLQPKVESPWRLAQAKLIYIDAKNKFRYTYEHEQLIDYQEKRNLTASQQHEPKNVYRVGSLVVDIVVPFALSRILFNGVLNREKLGSDSESCSQTNEQVSARLSFSTHPTGDKFDYKYCFSTKYLAEIIQRSVTNTMDASRLLELVLEDRIDLTIMYRGELVLFDSDTKEVFVMWGLKSKRAINAQRELSKQSSTTIESMTLWSDFGHVIHLSRPVGYPSLVYGFVHCDFDYSSHLYAASCLVSSGVIETDFGRLTSFSKLAPGVKMTLRAFKQKDFHVELPNGIDQADGQSNMVPFKVIINGFEGWGLSHCDNPGEQIKCAQSRLWTLDIHDPLISYKLASENLLGGKGHSLLELSHITAGHQTSVATLIDPERSLGCNDVTVPKGLVVSSVAYQMWLDSNPLIASSIRELDTTRRSLVAKSYYVNSFSDKHVTPVQQQQTLRAQCKMTSLVLSSCSLPVALRKQLYTKLCLIFGESELVDLPSDETDINDAKIQERLSKQKKFAVRSSAMGEDSLETSAAGQMKTILDARGFKSICRAIVSCWASQFELEAVTYKTQNGLLFNWPMAVVVQELVDCHSAGVAATCNPISGAPKQLKITANLGLGEGVVSGKKTDTVEVSLRHIPWNFNRETHAAQLGSNDTGAIKKLVDSEQPCCLSDDQIIAISNLLLWLRDQSEIKQREVEWGLTLVDEAPESVDKSSSSSFCSTHSSIPSLQTSSNQSGPKVARKAGQQFRLHLLQSRPLTNLNHLSTAEIYHELDSGLSDRHELFSRANIGEVMPGALSPLALTFFLQYVRLIRGEGGYEKIHTVEPYAKTSFSHYGRAVALVLTNIECVKRFRLDVEQFGGKRETMIGLEANEYLRQDLYKRILKEKEHPNLENLPVSLLRLFILDSGAESAWGMYLRSTDKVNSYLTDIISIDDLLQQLEEPDRSTPLAKRSCSKLQLSRLNASSLALKLEPVGSFEKKLRDNILQLYSRLVTDTESLSNAWRHHIRSTMVNMALNKISMELIGHQRYYKQLSEEDSPNEVLNDFSILLRKGDSGRTESGNIANLLDQLVTQLCREGQLKQAQRMSCKELYDHLSSLTNNSDSALKFRKFMDLNGHRAYKEFDFAQLTWSDDPSHIIKSLESRLKIRRSSTDVNRSSQQDNRLTKGESEYEKVLAKIERGKGILIHYLLPRSRNAVIRREHSKSHLIKMIDRYRKAFRHLGAMLCLEGRIPDANLVFYMTVDELDMVVRLGDEHRIDLARYIYKARRRQQTSKIGDALMFPIPTMRFDDMMELFDGIIEGKPKSNTSNETTEVNSEEAIHGMTSCGGRVTGRACVVRSIEEIDTLQPNDILITYSIDVSWTVYFFTISGIVTEVGGIVSHGAVVAREYGIPTLCTAIGVCSKFKTGQMVTLDANKGIVYLAKEEDAQAKT